MVCSADLEPIAPMDVYFHTTKLAKTCNSAESMRAKWGDARAKKLQQRLSELRAAPSLAEISRLPPVRCHELSGDLKGHLTVDLGHPFRLLFIPANDPLPRKPDGGLDWSRVTAVEVVDVRDTH